ncbi:E3 ubiquitin-protein ligase MARCH3 isoform X1 [Vespula maculifrons]|uniref:E3 ubiquitin-protein ligase MARCH3 isoform X1 n=1 Tax=Vespula maculifrons TaxID=7453 RepID=A0ABD2CH92_VESMC
MSAIRVDCAYPLPVNLDHERSIPILPVVVPEGPSCNLNGRDTQQMSLGLGQQHRLTRSLVSVGSNVCRICHTNTIMEPLVSPCSIFKNEQRWWRLKNSKARRIHEEGSLFMKSLTENFYGASSVLSIFGKSRKITCKGTLAYVHLSCLERWLNQSCRSYCELCNYQFNANPICFFTCIVITFMGTFRPKSLRIWITHPHNRRNIQSDLLIFTLLSIVTIGLIIVCLWGMRYFIMEGKKIGISKSWTKGVTWFFLGIVILGYIATVYLLGKDQLSTWYRWWKSTVNVQLIVDPQLFRPTTESFQEYENQIMSISASNMKTPTESSRSTNHVSS